MSVGEGLSRKAVVATRERRWPPYRKDVIASIRRLELACRVLEQRRDPLEGPLQGPSLSGRISRNNRPSVPPPPPPPSNSERKGQFRCWFPWSKLGEMNSEVFAMIGGFRGQFGAVAGYFDLILEGLMN